MVKYGGTSAFLGIVSLIVLSLFLSLFSGVAGIFIGKAIRKNPYPFILLPLIWVSRDWVIEKVFGGFPWCLAGYSQFKHLFFIQWAEWGGIHLITFLLIYFNVMIYKMIREKNLKCLSAVLASLVLIDSVGFGLMTIQQRRAGKIEVNHAGIIQPNITHDRIFDFQSSSVELKRLFQISESLKRKGAEFVVWPEYTIPIYPRQTPFFLKQFADFSGRQIPILAGFTDYQNQNNVFNSMFLFDGSQVSQYDKVHLTPFGEYVLFRKWLFFVKKITDEIGDFTPGRGIHTLPLRGHRLATPICYEIIYPELVKDFIAQGGEIIITASNDSWFGLSSAPYQHLSMAVFRCIENRRYLLRSTSNGISAAIDPTGKITYQAKMATAEIYLARFRYLSHKTVFTRIGFLFPLLSVFLVILIFILDGIQAIKIRGRHSPHSSIS
jgi:apolipoprotein N-acyltransferase